MAHNTGLAGTSFAPSTSFLAGNRYQVFLRAVDSGGKAGSWAAPQEFDVVSADVLVEDAIENGNPEGSPDAAVIPTDAVLVSVNVETPVAVAVEKTVESATIETVKAEESAQLDRVLTAWSETEWWNEERTHVADAEVAIETSDASLLIAAAAVGASIPVVRDQQERRAAARYDQRLQ